MKSISIKIKLATIFAISILVGVAFYAKADRTFSDNSDTDRYSIESDESTNLDASINAHPRASEYTSSEYSTKMAPSTTEATEYLAMHVSQDDGESYGMQQAPTPGQRPAQSGSTTYQDFGVRSAVTSNKSVKSVKSENTESSYVRKEVPTDYSKAVNNAVASDEAYQVKSTPQKSSGGNYGGYAVRSAKGKDITGGAVPSRQSANTADASSYGGYAVKSASGGSKTSSAGDYGGYAVKSAGGGKRAAAEMTAEGYGKKTTPYSTHNGFFDEIQAGGRAQLAQYDNAKQGDMAYQVRSVPQNSGGDYGGYAVRSAGGKNTNSKAVASNSSKGSYGGYAVKSAGGRDISSSKSDDGYAVRSVPQTSKTTNYAQTSTPGRSAESEYGGYAVRSAGGKDISSRAVASNSSNESYGGYAVRSSQGAKTGTSIAQYENASNSDNAYQVKSIPQNTGESYGGYSVRSAGGKDVTSRHVASNSSNNEEYGGYAVKSAGKSNAASNETYEGYAVRSIKGERSARQSTSLAQASPRSNRLTIYDGTKVYNSRGQRVGLNAPQKDRSVIVMPMRGRSIAGVVIQDDPGRSIVVRANSGAQSTFKYGEIDALVNL